MPGNLSIVGPAGAGKSQAARELLRTGKVDLAADFQSIAAALLLLERDPVTGRYPPRDARFEKIIPLAQAVRSTVIAEARERGLTVAATSSNGSPAQRQRLIAELGGASEIVIDPGRAVVEQRLADPVTGQLLSQCREAIGRYYDNL